MSRQQGRYSKRETGGNPGYPSSVMNGRVPAALMRACVSQPHLKGSSRDLWPVAARALDDMADAARQDGIALRLVAGYRDFAGQQKAKRDWTAAGKPENAARPGYSSHGWGSAIDVDRHSPDTRGILPWLAKNGPRFGWDHPLWAGSAKGPEYGREPWHWQLIRGWVPPEAEMEQVPLARIIPNAEAYIDDGTGWAWVRPLALELNATITDAGEESCSLVYRGKLRVFEGPDYRFSEGRGYVKLTALAPLGVRAGYARCLTLETD